MARHRGIALDLEGFRALDQERRKLITAVEQLKRAGDKNFERLWQLPLFDEYFEDMKSETADMRNSCNDSYGGTIIAKLVLPHAEGKAVRPLTAVADGEFQPVDRWILSRLADLAARVLPKVTRRLVGFAFVCYLVAYIDRVNVGFVSTILQAELGIGNSGCAALIYEVVWTRLVTLQMETRKNTAA